MHPDRRRFLVTFGHWVAVGGAGLLAACQGQQQPPITVTLAPTTSSSSGAAPSSPAPASTAAASPGVIAAASPKPAAGPSPSPAVAAAPSAAPAASPAAAAAAASPAPVAAGARVGKPMYQMDPLHTGRSPHMGPRRLGLLRTFNTTAPENRPPDLAQITTPDIQSSTAVAPDGTIYLGTFSGWTYALKDSPSASDRLDMAWRFRPQEGGTPAHATPAIGRDGTVYIGYTTGTAPNQKGTLFALRQPSSGQDAQIAWQTDIGDAPVRSSPALTDDGTLYIVNTVGLISVLDTANGGRLKWTAQIGNGQAAQFGQTIKVGPAVAPDGTVYVPTLTGSLYAAAPPAGSGNQGSVKWSFDFGQHLGPTPLVSTPVTGLGNTGQDAVGSADAATIGPDGTIYIGANNSNFYAIDASGQQKWLFEAERELAGIWSAGVLSPDASVVYFGANKGGIYALNTRDGSLKWQFPIFGSVYSSTALDARGTLYSASTVGSVYAIDAAAGEKIAEYPAGAPVWTAPAIRPDGTLVVADRNGRVLVLGES